MLENLLSPAVLFFVLGILAALVKSDLKIPQGLSETLSIYLLIAIGIKGGIELSHFDISTIITPMAGAIFLGCIIPVIAFVMARKIKLDVKNAIGLAASYGSVSIVTYGAAVSFLEKTGTNYEGFMNALVVLMESPAIFISLMMMNILEREKTTPALAHGIVSPTMSFINKEVLKDSLFGKSVFLLVGALLIGWMLGEKAMPTVKPLFVDMYGSVLMLFLLNMGIVTGQRLPVVRRHGVKLLAYGVLAPMLFGSLGVIVGMLTGLSVGGVTLLGVLAGSASYIAAPAALRAAVPEANPSIYLGLSLGVTFPFNLILGIPLYHQLAQMFV